MQYRLGTCSSCKAQFRVPATFQADRAKCKKCDGVVEIGPVEGAAPQPAPEPPKASPPAERPQPAAPAAAPRPAAPAPQPAAAPKPAAATPPPAKAPAPRTPARPKPEPGPVPAPPRTRPAAPAAKQPAGTAPKGARAGDSVRDAAEAAAQRVRNAGPRKRPAAAAGRTSEPAAAAPVTARKGSGASRGRRRRPEKKKSKAPALISIAALVVAAAVGGWYFLGRGPSSETQAAESQTSEDLAALDTGAGEAEATGAETASEPAAGADEDATAEAPDEAAAEVEAPEPEPEPEPDPGEVDLASLPEFGKLPETSEETWNDITEWTATFLDPAAGAAGNRARAKLVEAGYEAMPALVNALVDVDFSTDEGYRTGDLLQKALMDLCGGNNYGWKYTTEPRDVLYNKKAARLWHSSWQQVVDNRRAWILLGKLSEEEGEEFMARFEGVDLDAEGGSDEEVGSSDALEDF